MRTRTDNSFMPRIGIAQIAIESKTCPSDSITLFDEVYGREREKRGTAGGDARDASPIGT